eukprot:scaffold324_cov394-Prasinococcus_capsulatus_cf.AAC.33
MSRSSSSSGQWTSKERRPTTSLPYQRIRVLACQYTKAQGPLMLDTSLIISSSVAAAFSRASSSRESLRQAPGCDSCCWPNSQASPFHSSTLPSSSTRGWYGSEASSSEAASPGAAPGPSLRMLSKLPAKYRCSTPGLCSEGTAVASFPSSPELGCRHSAYDREPSGPRRARASSMRPRSMPKRAARALSRDRAHRMPHMPLPAVRLLARTAPLRAPRSHALPGRHAHSRSSSPRAPADVPEVAPPAHSRAVFCGHAITGGRAGDRPPSLPPRHHAALGRIGS